LEGTARHDDRRRSLIDRRIVVVGGTGGLGSAVVDELLAAGAQVLASGRSEGRLRELERKGARTLRLDLGDQDFPRKLAEAVERDADGALDGLVVATGALGPIGPTRTIDLASLRQTLDEHLVAVLGLVQACAAFLDRGTDPSVVLFAGGGATSAFPRYSAYALAKVGIVRLVENLAAEEPAWKVNAVAPGFVATTIHEPTLAAGPEVVGPYFDETRRRLGEAVPPEQASALVGFLLSSASNGISGRLISAPWDAWDDPEFQEQLGSDPSLGRLRRIDGDQFVARRPRR
jgi:NAD(P)-dependent dehydrogenase (short-subunit alcohol dehydrogenase family)